MEYDLMDDVWEVFDNLTEAQRCLAMELLNIAVAEVIMVVGSVDEDSFRFCVAKAADKAEEGFEDGD